MNTLDILLVVLILSLLIVTSLAQDHEIVRHSTPESIPQQKLAFRTRLCRGLIGCFVLLLTLLALRTFI